MIFIDLNCDLGEGAGCDEQLMPLITSANIACGGHAGDEASMRRAIHLAKQFGVNAGAHPSYPDRANFGRVKMEIPVAELQQTIEKQIRDLRGIAESEGIKLRHVKLHGALYNAAARDRALAVAMAQTVSRVDASLAIVGLPNSELVRAAKESGLRFIHECFADRTYQPDGSLTPRSQPGAVIEHESHALAQAMQITTQQQVTTATGQTIPLKADTICVHGDGKHALAVLSSLRQGLASAGVQFRAF